MPNACVDLVFYVSDPSWGEGPATVVAPPHRSYVVGSTLRSFMVRSVGWRHIVGASLLPAGVDEVLKIPSRFGTGYMLPIPDVLPLGGPGTFGHPGNGGALGYADPDAGIGFGYVMNRMASPLTDDPRAGHLVDAVRACL